MILTFRIYDILDQGYNWITVKEFLNEMTLESINYDSEAVNDTDISLGEKLTSQSISRQVREPSSHMLIHEAYLQSRPVVNTIFTRGVRPSVPTFQNNLAMQNNFQLRIVMATGGTVGLAEGIIDDTCVFLSKIRLAEVFFVFTISLQFIDELATAAVRTNYGQMPDDIHAFVGEVALAGAENGLWSVSGGNRKVAELLLKKSEARLVTGEVGNVYKDNF